MGKIFVVAGHGAGDSGACGGGFQEQERVRVLGNKMKELSDDVVLGDFSKNYYKSNLIHTIPKDSRIVELHMDSSSAASAKGGHVIIKAGIGGADKYDKALADFIAGMYPGRYARLVERSDLANPTRAYQSGINYRLLEVCFISNSGDLAKFNSNIEATAKGIIIAMGGKIKEKPVTPAKPSGVLYRVQVGAFSEKANAEKLQNELKSKGYDCFIAK